MSESNNPENFLSTNEKEKPKTVKPLNCFLSSLFAGGMSFLIYNLMSSIIDTYATKPVISDNLIVLKITVAVRTLVIGIAALGTGVCALVGLGLFLLGIQIALKDTIKIFSKS